MDDCLLLLCVIAWLPPALAGAEKGESEIIGAFFGPFSFRFVSFWWFDSFHFVSFNTKLQNVSCEYDRWVLETRLCKRRDTSDTLIGCACAMFHLKYGNMMFSWIKSTIWLCWYAVPQVLWQAVRALYITPEYQVFVFGQQPKQRYTWSIFTQKQVYAQIKWKTHHTTHVIGRMDIGPVFER